MLPSKPKCVMQTTRDFATRWLAGIGFVALLPFAQAYGATIVKVSIGKDGAGLKTLHAKGYDIAGVNLEQGTADILWRDGELGLLDLSTSGLAVRSSTTVDTKLVPDSQYKTPEQVATLLQDWVSRYPQLAHLESIGKSLEGRDIWALRITGAAAASDRSKPAVLYNGEHHARELMSVEVVLDTAEYLLTNYGQDSKVTKWVDSTEIWVVPMVNPDGSNKVWTENNLWRKNARDGYGVDINRNYPYLWNACNGSSDFQYSDAYHGPSAASEPETKVMMAFVSRIQPVFNISYHSYSELVLYPYGCDGQYAEQKAVMAPIANAMANLIPSETGSGNYRAGTPWELLYNADGNDMDWMYHDQHVLSYAMEVTSDQSGFQPSYSHRQAAVEAVRPAWQLLLDRVQQSGVRGYVRAASGAALTGTTTLTVTAANHAGDGTDSSIESGAMLAKDWEIKHDGSYQVILNPGTYNLSFSRAGQTLERQVTVGATRVDLDVQL